MPPEFQACSCRCYRNARSISNFTIPWRSTEVFCSELITGCAIWCRCQSHFPQRWMSRASQGSRIHATDLRGTQLLIRSNVLQILPSSGAVSNISIETTHSLQTLSQYSRLRHFGGERGKGKWGPADMAHARMDWIRYWPHWLDTFHEKSPALKLHWAASGIIPWASLNITAQYGWNQFDGTPQPCSLFISQHT
jgi:hypothetical protein